MLDDGPVHAVKVGLLGSAAAVEATAAALRPFAGHVPIVVDPVLSATAGGFEAPGDLAAAYREHLLPLASLATPNLPELEVLGAGSVQSLLATGCGAVLQKRGHADGEFACDELHTAAQSWTFRRPRRAVGPVRGTGCALASAIAARLAAGATMADACGAAGDWLAELLRALGPAAADDLPRVLPFAACVPKPL